MKELIIAAGAIALATMAPAYARPGNGHGNGHAYGYGAGGCPPGLRDKGCMPPGQAKKMFRTGQRYDTAYGRLYAYRQIPYSIRRQYDLTSRYRYYYEDGYLYAVNPRTLLIERVISALLR